MKVIPSATTQSAMQPSYPVPAASEAWTLVDQKAVCLMVMRVVTEHVRKENVYGNELPYTERITYTLKGGIIRDASQVFRTKDELRASL